MKIGSCKSDESFLTLGVPQGSVLDPILFLIYIDSIFSLKLHSTSIGFADDLSCVLNCKSQFDLSAKLNADLEMIRHWFLAHKLVISSKTKLMLFNPFGANYSFDDFLFTFHSAGCKKFMLSPKTCIESNSTCSFQSNVLCSSACFNIDFVATHRHLGLFVDKELSFKFHIGNLRSYLRVCTRQLYALQSICSKEVLRKVYFGLCHSKIQYGITCWGSALDSHLLDILVIQKHLVRLINSSNRYSRSFPIFKTLNILPVKHLYLHNILKIFFASNLNNTTTRSYSYSLRSIQNRLVTVPAHRFRFLLFTFDFLSPRLFNLLPLELKVLSPSKSSFLKLKRWLFEFDHDEIKNFSNIIA